MVLRVIQLITLAAFLAPSQVRGQLQFETIAGRSSNSRGANIIATSDGGFLTVGMTTSAEKDEEIFLLKTDSAGTILWSKTYGGPARDVGTAVLETSEGLLVAAYTESFGVGGFDCHIMKTDPAGNRVWSTTHGALNDDLCRAMLIAADGGTVLAGESLDSDSREDCHLLKTDESGNKLWSRTYGGPREDRCFSVAAMDDGGFLLVGETHSEGAGDRDAFVVKTDGYGKMKWSKTFGGPGSDGARHVTQLADGSYLVTGFTGGADNTAGDPFLIKLDPSGDSLWTKTLTIDGHNRTFSGDETSNGDFCLTGFSEFPETEALQAVLVRTDGDGNLISFEKVLPDYRSESAGHDVRAIGNTSCVVTGYVSDSESGDRDVFVAKVTT